MTMSSPPSPDRDEVGYRPKFGLVAVNRETQERTVKPSARYLGEMARRNGR